LAKLTEILAGATFGNAVLAACLLCGCGDAGATGGAGGQGGSPAAEVFGSTECGQCVTIDACADEIASCTSDPGCASYLDCLLACPVTSLGDADPTCDAGCAGDGSTETTKLRAGVTGCRLYGAGAACGPCGIPSEPTSETLNQTCEPRPDPPTACRACYWEKCCDTWDACYAEGVNPDCDALGTCVSACGQPLEPCIDACFAAHPDSVTTALTQVACGLSQCAADQPECDMTLRDACDTCLLEDCGDPFVELMSTGEGYLFFTCLAECDGTFGTGCVAPCLEAHPDAEEDGLLFLECVSIQCETLC